MRLQPIELTEDSTLEDIAKEVYQCYIHLENTRDGYYTGSASGAEIKNAVNELYIAMDKLRIKLYKP
jgi:hypothetical protein